MNRFGKVLAGAAVAGMLAVIPAVGASAAPLAPRAVVSAETFSSAPGGGTWQHGTDAWDVFSNYYHSSKSHTATACDNGGLVKTCKQAVAIKGNWASSKTTKSYFGGNTAFWNTL
ncbi:lactococcin 972 family bacteriocin [Leifsonia sp. NPDC058248]|uniref:lactococcin 972 family bacteriocin n=1 Tax=Leifsonia sp. NPDC058248 TaxID=3346402 RepID=UPI0036DDBE48